MPASSAYSVAQSYFLSSSLVLPSPCSYADDALRHRFVNGEAVEGHRQHRREEDVEETGGKHTALAGAPVDVKPLRFLAAVKAYAYPHVVTGLEDDGDRLGRDTPGC